MNIFQRGVNWIEAQFNADEQAVVDFMAPLANQIYQAALTLGKQDLQIGLQVLKDSVATAVAAGASAIASGGNAVQAAETTFLTTAAGEGKTALNNAESAAIKVGVAIAQQAATAFTTPTAAGSTAPSTVV